MVKNIIAFLGLLMLLALGYYLFVLNDSDLDTSNAIVVNRAEAETREFLQRLNELKMIELNTAILSDERFSNLATYETPVPAVLVGRDNPFIPAN